MNTNAHGSLSATIIAKTSSPAEEKSLDEAILGLNYGSIGVNISGILSIYYPQLVWGGYPRNVDAAHLQSGIGFVSSHLMPFQLRVISVWKFSGFPSSH